MFYVNLGLCWSVSEKLTMAKAGENNGKSSQQRTGSLKSFEQGTI